MILFIHCQDCGTRLKARAHKIAGRCLPCREQVAKQVRKGWCVAPMHKSNYMLITSKDLLAGLNNKGGLIK